jgi:hypothetical protein
MSFGIISGGFGAPLQQASLSQNAQWRSQNLFKPSIEFFKLFWDITQGAKFLSFNVITAT